ncbi:MAG: hypothetical protein J7K35_05630 [Syntrophobacterales bacterium]|nr:hypothetical protein [Syntrophobacterales bacterium]
MNPIHINRVYAENTKFHNL